MWCILQDGRREKSRILHELSLSLESFLIPKQISTIGPNSGILEQDIPSHSSIDPHYWLVTTGSWLVWLRRVMRDSLSIFMTSSRCAGESSRRSPLEEVRKPSPLYLSNSFSFPPFAFPFFPCYSVTYLLPVLVGLTGIRVEPVIEERAIRCLQRIELLSSVRLEVELLTCLPKLDFTKCQSLFTLWLNFVKTSHLCVCYSQILPHPDFDVLIELCEQSFEVPSWWIPASHDRDLLKGVAK